MALCQPPKVFATVLGESCSAFVGGSALWDLEDGISTGRTGCAAGGLIEQEETTDARSAAGVS